MILLHKCYISWIPSTLHYSGHSLYSFEYRAINDDKTQVYEMMQEDKVDPVQRQRVLHDVSETTPFNDFCVPTANVYAERYVTVSITEDSD